MKIEIGESLACSWLRHVRKCWLVQANWKFSEHWERHLNGTELEELFNSMKGRFDRGGGVFKQTRNAAQLLQQGEIDVVGVDHEGGVHAAEVAFHEAGLHYRNADTKDNVLKKMLRTLLILRALHPPETRLHIYFLSPKVICSEQKPLEDTFKALCAEYPCVEWQLVTNDDFTKTVVRPTLDKASKVADSSELFVRSAKLINLAGYLAEQRPRAERTTSARKPGATVPSFQDLVKNLMKTLLVDVPELLSPEERHGLRDKEYRQKTLDLKISIPLLREVEDGHKIKGRNRYWKDPFGDFYVCSQWRSYNHDARVLLDFVEKVAACNEGKQGAEELERHTQAFRHYLAGA